MVDLVICRIITAGGKRGLALSTKGTLEVLKDAIKLKSGHLATDELRTGGRLSWETIINGLFSNYHGLDARLIDEICSEVANMGGRNVER